MRDAQADVPSAGWLRAQLAFKDSMIRGILQFTPSIAFRYVLHRCESRDIRCRESLFVRSEDAGVPCADRGRSTTEDAGVPVIIYFLGATCAGVCCWGRGREDRSAVARRPSPSLRRL